MQQAPPGPAPRPIRIIFGDLEVAGYFQEGKWFPCNFAEFVRIIHESPNGPPPVYLKPIKGFRGIVSAEISTLPFMPLILTPHFCEHACRGDACENRPSVAKGMI